MRAPQTEAEGREPQRPGLQDGLLRGQLGSGEEMGVRAGVFGLKDQEVASLHLGEGLHRRRETLVGGVSLPHVRSGSGLGSSLALSELLPIFTLSAAVSSLLWGTAVHRGLALGVSSLPASC